MFDFPPYINYYTRYPETLFDGIARVGGFFASSKLLLIALYFINRFWFERKVKSINGFKVNDAVTAIVRIRSNAPGDRITVVTESGGTNKTFNITLGSAPALP